MKRLYRDRFDKKIGGVCGGIAQFLKLDSSIVRLLFILLSVVTGGIMVLVYLLFWLVLPEGPRAYIEPQYKRLYRSRRDRRIAGVCGGFGVYFGIDPNLIRIGFLVGTALLAFIPGVIAYIIAATVIPEEYR